MERYEALRAAMTDTFEGLDILAGNRVRSSDPKLDARVWQEVAGAAADNLRVLADLLDVLREGGDRWKGAPLTGPVVFPDLIDVLPAGGEP